MSRRSLLQSTFRLLLLALLLGAAPVRADDASDLAQRAIAPAGATSPPWGAWC